MATIVAVDLRRTDLRNKGLGSTWNLTSGEITNVCDDLGGLLFSFPKAKYTGVILINSVMLEVVTAFDGTPVITFGFGTLATDAITTGGDITIVDADMLMTTAVAIPGTIGLKIQGASGFVTGLVTSIPATQVDMIVPADATVPAVYCTLTGTTAITTGSAYLHLNVTHIPSVG